jgi:hypothetical protein
MRSFLYLELIRKQNIKLLEKRCDRPLPKLPQLARSRYEQKLNLTQQKIALVFKL